MVRDCDNLGSLRSLEELSAGDGIRNEFGASDSRFEKIQCDFIPAESEVHRPPPQNFISG